MSGVIDDNGQQWEHCSKCHEFVEIEKLVYITPDHADNELGLDLCPDCLEKFLEETLG